MNYDDMLWELDEYPISEEEHNGAHPVLVWALSYILVIVCCLLLPCALAGQWPDYLLPVALTLLGLSVVGGAVHTYSYKVLPAPSNLP